MERINTEKKEYPTTMWDDLPIMRLAKLKDYESTGLNPQQVEDFKKDYQEFLDSRLEELKERDEKIVYWEKEAKRLSAELGEINKKQVQGLMMELPCKVGTTLYDLSLNETVFERVYYFDGKATGILLIDKKDGEQHFVNALCIGETVFLTRAEAEDKLKEMEEQ